MLFDANLRLGRLGASTGPSFCDAPSALRTMERYNVNHAMVYHALAKESDYIEGNRLLSSLIQNHRDRLTPSYVIVPNREDANRTIALLDEHDVPAVRLFPNTSHFSIAPWCIGELAQSLCDAQKLLVIDFDTLTWANDGVDWQSLDQLAAAFPKLNILLAGVATAGSANYTPLLARHTNLYLEISKLSTPGEINRLIDRGHANQIIFGSDMPTRHIGAPLRMIELLNITTQQKNAIFAGNLMRLLRVNHAQDNMQAQENSQAINISSRKLNFDNIVDTHIHLGGWNPSAAGTGVAADTIADMDRCNIQRVVATSLWSCYGEVARGNDYVAQAAATYPNRIHGYLTLDPKHPAEVQQQIEQHGDNPAFVGMKLHGATHAIQITDERCHAALDYANMRNWPVLIHGNFVPEPWQEVAPKYPNANLIIAHISGCGHDAPGAQAIARLARTQPNLYFDIASSASYFEFLPRLIELAGANKILYGSDHPIFDFGYELGQVIHSDITPADKQLILSDNAHRLFGFKRVTPLNATQTDPARISFTSATPQR